MEYDDPFITLVPIADVFLVALGSACADPVCDHFTQEVIRHGEDHAVIHDPILPMVGILTDVVSPRFVERE